MSDETNDVVDSSQTNDTASEPTLDDVYASVKFDEPAAPVQAAPSIPAIPNVQQVQQPVPSAVPDPYDSEAFKAYMARQEAGTTELKQALSSTIAFLSNAQQEQAKKAIEADIQDAVKTVNEVVGFDKPKVVEAMLDAKAREDVRFKKLWDNRKANPTAWNNALKAVSREIANDLSVKVDPNLTKAQQARRLSQSQMATTSKDEPDESWNNMSQDDFQRKWEQMVSRGA
jgi:hypothetical protein